MLSMSESTPTKAKRGRSRERESIPVTRTLDRGLAILEAVADAGELSLSDIARATQMSASTAFRLIETLEQRGFLMRADDSGLYRVGARAFDVGTAFAAAAGASRLGEAARPLMRRLAEELGESVALGVRDGQQAVYVEQVEARGAVRMIARLGSRMPMHCTGIGKALLAWLWESRVDEIVGPAPYARATAATLTDREALLRDLAAVRERGHALDLQEYEADVRCVAAPVRNREGEVVAAMSVSGPTGRMAAARQQEIAAQLVQTADELSRRLGWRGVGHAPATTTPQARRADAVGPPSNDHLFTD
jgi:DNA-binding IclR family transcriptional regulator